jgi:hypothetical protein
MDNIKEKLELLAFGKYNKNVNNLTVGELYDVLGTLVISNISPDWQKSMTEHINSQRYYLFPTRAALPLVHHDISEN